MRQAHSSCRKGKRVRVVLKNGEKFVDKFLDKDTHKIYFENRTINKKDLKAFGIFKKEAL